MTSTALMDEPRPRGSSAGAYVAGLDWTRIAGELDAAGCAVIRNLLREEDCRMLAALYDDETPFRSRIVMARHGFGRGEYKYFAAPLPPLIAELRTELYPPLAAIANGWNERLGVSVRYPADHAAFLERCHDAGQRKPTPLLLRYRGQILFFARMLT